MGSDPGCARALASSRGDLTVKGLARSGDLARTIVSKHSGARPSQILGYFTVGDLRSTPMLGPTGRLRTGDAGTIVLAEGLKPLRIRNNFWQPGGQRPLADLQGGCALRTPAGTRPATKGDYVIMVIR